MSGVDARSIRRRFLLLRGLRWLPNGLLIPVLVLLLIERGLSLAQIGLVTAAQGLVVLVLEVPTGGLADAIGRKPVLLLAASFDIASHALLIVAGSLPLLVVVYVLQGVYRALESGPLDAWYVDAALAADPDADIEGGLSAGGVVVGLAIAAGALTSGGLVALDLALGVEALAVPIIASLVLRLLDLAALSVLVSEVGDARGLAALRRSAADVPRLVGEAGRLLRGSRVLIALVSVEIFWGFGMTTFEIMLPPRLAEVVGNADHAAALLGPAGAAAWLAVAAGAAVIPLATRRFGAAVSGAGLRVLQGATVVGMGLAAGPIGVLAAYLGTYAVHGAANPVHLGLLHRQVTSAHRTTVTSINSMMGMPAGAVGGIVLGFLADATSISTAMVAGAVVLAAAAPLYLVARHAPGGGRARRAPAPVTSV